MVIFEDARGRTLMRVEDSAKELDLCPLEVNERCVNLAEGLQSLPHLQKLTLRLRDESWPVALEVLPKLPRLVDLGILGPAAGVDLSPLATCTSLRALGLFGLYQVNVAPLGNLHNIEKLTIDGHVTHIEVVRGLRQLKTLCISHNKKSVSIKLLSDIQSLDHLSLVGSSHLAHVKEFGSLRSLRFLDLRGTNFESFDVLPADGKLEVLQLDRCRRLQSLEGAGRIHSLRDLWINELKEIPTLAPLEGLDNLTSLLMDKTIAKDGKLRVLSKLKSLLTVTLPARYGDEIVEVAHLTPRCHFALRDIGPQQPWGYNGDLAIYGKVYSIDPFKREEWIQQDLRPLFGEKSNRAIETLVEQDLRRNNPDILSKLTFASTDTEFIVRSEDSKCIAQAAERTNVIAPPERGNYRAPPLKQRQPRNANNL